MDSHARDALDSYHYFSGRLLGETSAAFGKLLSQQQSLDEVLEELHHNRASCREWMEKQSGMSQECFCNCRSFLALLDEAIKQQNEEVKIVRDEKDASRHSVEERHRQRKAIEQVIERGAEKARIFARRREQKNQDEQAVHLLLQAKK